MLTALVEIGLEHDTTDGIIAGLNLLQDVHEHDGLPCVVFARIPVRAVDHNVHW